MTKQEYDALPVREKDALVATEVMGLPIGACRNVYWIIDKDHDPPWAWGMGRKKIPHFHTDIAAAWTVMEKMREDMPFQLWDVDGCGGEWTASFEESVRTLHRGTAPTAPAAICEAALRAKGVITDANGGNE